MLSELDGKYPSIDETAFVSESAHLIGDVRVSRLASVWPGVVIRADSGSITIGERTNVQDNSVIHADYDAYIGDGVTIGHGVICHADGVGDESLIGNGAVLSHGVTVGKGCLIAAGAVVTDNTDIEDGMLTRGTPAKAIGRLRSRHVEMITRNAQAYVDRIERYKRASSPRNPI